MALHIIIDGYNLIRRSSVLSRLDRMDMQAGRESLIEKLGRYKKLRHHNITVVFDGGNAPVFSCRRDHIKGIHIEFSPENQTADSIIKKMVDSEREKAVVVTSDRDIVDFSTARGAAVIGSDEFEEKLDMTLLMDVKGMDIETEDHKGWTPTTKKKGPNKRLPKKKRRSRIKIKKL